MLRLFVNTVYLFHSTAIYTTTDFIDCVLVSSVRMIRFFEFGFDVRLIEANLSDCHNPRLQYRMSIFKS